MANETAPQPSEARESGGPRGPLPRRTNAIRLAVIALNVLMVGGVLLVLALPGPSKRQFTDRAPVRFWHMWSGEWKDVVDRIVARFNASQSRYEVVALSLPPDSANQKFLMSAAGGDPPDVMAQWTPTIPAWVDAGLLLPEEELMTPAEWADYQRTVYPVVLKLGTYHGHLYAVNTNLNVWACYYRPDCLAEVGRKPDDFPRDLDELWALGKQLNHRDAEGRFTRLGFLPTGWMFFAPLFGGGFYNEHTDEVTINTPGNLRSLTFLAECRKELGFDNVVRFESSLNDSGGGGEMAWPFISGDYCITLDGQWRVEQLARYAPDLQYRTAPLPPPPGVKSPAGFANGCLMIIPKGGRQAAGAMEFIRFWSGISDPERAAEFYTWGGWLPTSPRIANARVYREYVRKYPQFQTFLDLLPSENLQVPAAVPYEAYLSDARDRAEDSAMRGTLTPAAALSALQSDLDRELTRRKELGQ